jgi:hypothetical protein
MEIIFFLFNFALNDCEVRQQQKEQLNELECHMSPLIISKFEIEIHFDTRTAQHTSGAAANWFEWRAASLETFYGQLRHTHTRSGLWHALLIG